MRLVAVVLAPLLGAALFQLPNLSTQREVRVQIEIAATPELVWKVLTDFPAYEVWNPYIYPAKGEARHSAQLALTLRPGGKPVVFEPTVETARPNEELSWHGRTFGTLVFERVQTFTIESLGPHRVRLTAREHFAGLSVPLLGGLIDDTQHGMDMMTRALRTRAELLDFTLQP